MKLFELRKELKNEFRARDKEETDVDFIISEVLDVKRTDLALIEDVDDKVAELIRSKAELRLSNMPIDMIFGKAYFYGLEFEVNRNVLTPRPESELIVDRALHEIKENGYKNVLDMCSGSGCLGIAIKKHLDVDVTAVDISEKAIATAKRNAKKNQVEVDFIKSNMFEQVKGKYDIIVSNPPYIDSDEVKELSEEVRKYDPILALDGGDLGLKFYNILHDNIKKFLTDEGVMIFEIGEDQRELIETLFADCHLVEVLTDYSGHDRVMIYKK